MKHKTPYRIVVGMLPVVGWKVVYASEQCGDLIIEDMVGWLVQKEVVDRDDGYGPASPTDEEKRHFVPGVVNEGDVEDAAASASFLGVLAPGDNPDSYLPAALKYQTRKA